jgi:hypothetical protein
MRRQNFVHVSGWIHVWLWWDKNRLPSFVYLQNTKMSTNRMPNENMSTKRMPNEKMSTKRMPNEKMLTKIMPNENMSTKRMPNEKNVDLENAK